MTISEGAQRAAVYDEAKANVDHPLHGYVWVEQIVQEMSDLADRLAVPEGIDYDDLKRQYDRINGYFAKVRYYIVLRQEEQHYNATHE